MDTSADKAASPVSIGPTAGAAGTPHMWTWVVQRGAEKLIGYAQTEDQARRDAELALSDREREDSVKRRDGSG